MDRFQLVSEIQKSCEALQNYHLQVGNNYQEIVDHLKSIEATKLTVDETDILVNLVALPITTIFEKMEETKPGSPKYVYKLVCHAYTTYNRNKVNISERIET